MFGGQQLLLSFFLNFPLMLLYTVHTTSPRTSTSDKTVMDEQASTIKDKELDNTSAHMEYG
ncbi:MAG: hypothetical protein ACFCUV_09365 [Rivularia sp. (in: cyanobacteria)]